MVFCNDDPSVGTASRPQSKLGPGIDDGEASIVSASTYKGRGRPRAVADDKHNKKLGRSRSSKNAWGEEDRQPGMPSKHTSKQNLKALSRSDTSPFV